MLRKSRKSRASSGGSSSRLRGSMPKRHENYGVVTAHISIGNREMAQDARTMQDLGVTHVLNACAQLPNFHPNKFVYMNVNVLDAPNVDLVTHFRRTSEFLEHVEEENGHALVHCIAGCSRSVTLVLMHLVAKHDMTLREAYAKVRGVRPHLCPNKGFMLQLAKFEVGRVRVCCAGVCASTKMCAGSASLGLGRGMLTLICVGRAQVECHGRTSVATAKEWNFYQWNKIKWDYPRTTGKAKSSSRSSTCTVS